MATTIDNYDCFSSAPQQESPRPPTALKIRRCPTPSSPAGDGTIIASAASFSVASKTQRSRPNSWRLSMELDELLKWEGFNKPSFIGHASKLSHEVAQEQGELINESTMAIRSSDHPNSADVDDGESLSELNEMIASAKKKLDMLEDNLRGARDSLFAPLSLPSPPSTGSLRSTISSTFSNTFSAPSEGDEQPDSPIRSNIVAVSERFDSHTTQRNVRRSEYDPYSYIKGLPSQASAGQKLVSPIGRQGLRSDHIKPTFVLRTPLDHNNGQKQGSSIRVTTTDDHVCAHQTTLDALSTLRQPTPTTPPISVNLRKLSTSSNTVDRPYTPTPSSLQLRLRTAQASLSPDKHASVSTFTSSATETESFSSGWDSESDDTDTEELLHGEFEATWPVPPASRCGKPKFACERVVPSLRQPWGTYVDGTVLRPVRVVDDGVRAMPATPDNKPGRNDAATEPYTPHALIPRDMATPTPTPTSRTISSTPPAHANTSTQPSPPPQIYSSPRTDRKVLTAHDQAQAFALAESMHQACLWLRDGNEDEKSIWRERVWRAQCALRGEL